MSEDRLERIECKLDLLMTQALKTNGRVSTHSLILYPLAGAFLLLCGALLGKGIIDISLFH